MPPPRLSWPPSHLRPKVHLSLFTASALGKGFCGRFSSASGIVSASDMGSTSGVAAGGSGGIGVSAEWAGQGFRDKGSTITGLSVSVSPNLPHSPPRNEKLMSLSDYHRCSARQQPSLSRANAPVRPFRSLGVTQPQHHRPSNDAFPFIQRC